MSLNATLQDGDSLLTTESALTSVLKGTGENSQIVHAQVYRQTAVVYMPIMQQEHVLLLFSVLMDFMLTTHPDFVFLTAPQELSPIQTRKYVTYGATFHILETQGQKCV